MKLYKYLIFSLITSIFLINNSFAADADKGKTLFTKCKACHNADATKHKVGPHLVGIVGRKAASTDFGKYSDALKESGITWDEANLDKWLINPKAMYPKTKMLYPGLKKAEDRANVIEYLKTK